MLFEAYGLAVVVAMVMGVLAVGMALPASVKEGEFEDRVPEPLRDQYKKGDDGVYHLDLEGLGPDAEITHPGVASLRTTLDREREDRQKRDKELKDLRARYKDLDPDDYRRLQELEKKRKEDDAGGNPDKLEELVQERVAEREKELGRNLTTAEERAARAEAVADRLVVRDSIRAAAIEAGIHKEALDTVVMLAQRDGWTRDGDDPVLKRGEGEDARVVYGKDAKTPMTPEEWLPSLRESHPYLWPGSKGAGGQDDGGGDVPPPDFDPRKASIDQKTAFINKHGFEAWEKQLAKYDQQPA